MCMQDRPAHALADAAERVGEERSAPPLPIRQRRLYIENMRRQKRCSPTWMQRMETATEDISRLYESTRARNCLKIQQEAPDHLRALLCTERTRNVLAIQHLADMIQHPDRLLPRRVLHGFNSIGNGDGAGLWKAEHRPPLEEHELEEFYSMAVRLRRGEPKFDDGLLLAIFETIEEDTKEGRYKEISFEGLKCMPAMAFPKDETTPERFKVRTLIDRRAKNKYCRTTEKLELHGSRQIADLLGMCVMPLGREEDCRASPLGQLKKEATSEIVKTLEETRKRLAELKPLPGTLDSYAECLSQRVKAASEPVTLEPTPEGEGYARDPPEMASDDISNAYYLCGIDGPTSSPFTGYDPRVEGFRFWISYTLDMGAEAEPSVLAFCRIAEPLMAVAAHFGRPLLAYIDDQNYAAVNTDQIRVAKRFAHQLALTLGLELSDKPKAGQSSAKTDRVRALGLIYSYGTAMLTGCVTLWAPLPPEYIEKTAQALGAILHALRSKALPHKLTQKGIGLCTFATQHVRQKMGTEALRPLYKWLGEVMFEALIRKKLERRALKEKYYHRPCRHPEATGHGLWERVHGPASGSTGMDRRAH
ncbi:unnamed protein product [Amoebophrya sp. A25]|nr:unnamed protein product [Amoebophrya sp. A25]|eukprot:GSA25T00023409001.1